MNLKFLIIAALLSLSMGASAQNQYIKYKNYLIPISTGVDTTSPQCVGLSATANNVVYIDDIGLAPQDHNGFQDLAIILGLSNKFNLLAVGVGVPGKSLGLSPSNIPSSSITVTQSLVNATRIANKPPVLSGSALINKVVDYANCSSSSHKLIIATGGLWHDVASILDADSSISSNIRVVGITGSNLGSVGIDHLLIPAGSKTALQAFQQVTSEVSDVIEIDDPEFRGVLDATSNNGLTVANFATLFNRVSAINRNVSFRVADYGAIVLASNLKPRVDIYNKPVIAPLLIDAINYATTGNAN